MRRNRQEPTYSPYNFVPVQVPVNSPPPYAPPGYLQPDLPEPTPHNHTGADDTLVRWAKRFLRVAGWLIMISLVIGLGPISWFVAPFLYLAWKNSIWKKGNGPSREDWRTPPAPSNHGHRCRRCI